MGPTPPFARTTLRPAVAAFAALSAIFVAAACSSESSPQTPASPDASTDAAQDVDTQDAASLDAPDDVADAAIVDAPGDVAKSATCATTFGDALTDAFGRFDGTVVAVVPPNDQACALPNRTHLVIQLMMQGAVYRMVVDVLSNQGSPDVLIDEIDTPLVGDAWAEGWHTGATLDYATTLNVHSTAFTAMKQADLVAKITSELEIGARVSVFSTSDGEHDSTHLVHRNTTNADGAIVVRPDGAPHYILLRFDEQAF